MSGPIGRPWTAKEDQRLIELRAAEVNVQDIADALNRTNRAVRAPTRLLMPPAQKKVHPAKNPGTKKQAQPLRPLLAGAQRYKQTARVTAPTRPAIKARVAYL